jgi:hypothetical protein
MILMTGEEEVEEVVISILDAPLQSMTMMTKRMMIMKKTTKRMKNPRKKIWLSSTKGIPLLPLA